jgi:hypothetical protein
MASNSKADIRPDDVLPFGMFVQRHANIASPGSLRWQIFCSAQNGLDEAGAILRRGRKVFIVVPRYMDWLVGQGNARQVA